MKRFVALLIVIVLLSSCLPCVNAEDAIDHLFELYDSGRTKNKVSVKRSKIGDTDVVSYSLGQNYDFQYFYVNDVLMGCFVSYPDILAKDYERYLMTCAPLNSIFGSKYTDFEYDRILMILRDGFLACGLPLNYYKLTDPPVQSVVWVDGNAVAILLTEKDNRCRLFAFADPMKAKGITSSIQNNENSDDFLFRGVPWGCSIQDVTLKEGPPTSIEHADTPLC